MNKPNNQSEEEEFLSINDVIAIHRAAHPNRNKWLFKAHMFFLTIWLMFRYIIVRAVIVYMKDLVADIRRGL
jgi:hypothetical protein